MVYNGGVQYLKQETNIMGIEVKKYLTCLERKILSQSSQHVMLSPSVKAIEFTALLASIGFFWSFLAELAGPGLGLLLGPGFLLGAGAGAAGDESLDFSEADSAF